MEAGGVTHVRVLLPVASRSGLRRRQRRRAVQRRRRHSVRAQRAGPSASSPSSRKVSPQAPGASSRTPACRATTSDSAWRRLRARRGGARSDPSSTPAARAASRVISRASSNGTRRRRSCSRIAPSRPPCGVRVAPPNVRFDTSLWNSLDVRTPARQAAPEDGMARTVRTTRPPATAKPSCSSRLLAPESTGGETWPRAAEHAARRRAPARLGEPLAIGLPLPSRPRLRAHEYLVLRRDPAVPPDFAAFHPPARRSATRPTSARAWRWSCCVAEATWPIESTTADRSENLTPRG